MNHIYRAVWNEARRCFVAVPETARCHVKRGTGTLRRLGVAAVLGCCGAPWGLLPVQAAPPDPGTLPTQAQVSTGQASISSTGRPGAPVMAINQTTDRATINWGSFDVGRDATVQFNQPGPQAATLNRVTGATPSQIFGKVTAPGQVFVLNPNGILFGATAQVDVGGLVATTHKLSDADFMAGRLFLERAGATGAVINEGSIRTALAGYAALLAPEVRNNGLIVARLGTVVLAAGEAYTLQMEGSSLIGLTVAPATIDALVNNGQAVQAPGGLIILSAKAAQGLASGIVRHSGSLDATGVALRNGRIVLEASDQTLVTGNATLDASSSTSQGGQITLTGRQIALADQSHLDARGATGGGTVHVGGDWQGGGTTAQAQAVYVGKEVTLDASATSKGNGGEVVLWSDTRDPASATRVYGTVRATGGTGGGDGGRIETSGHWLDVDGIRVHANAAPGQSGQSGTWLLDPYNLNVTSSSTTASTASGPPYTFSSGAGATNVKNTDIEAQLNNGTSVTLQTTGVFGDGLGSGNVTVSANISKTTGGDATLKLVAHKDVILSSNVSISATTGKLNVILNGDVDDTGGGSVHLNTGSSISSNGGNITLGGGTAGDGTGYAKGNSTNVAGIYLDTGSSLNAAGGDISMHGVGYAGNTSNLQYGIGLAGATVSTSGNGTITLVGTGGAGTNATNNAGIDITAHSTVNGGGVVNMTGTGGAATGSTNSNRGVNISVGSVVNGGTGLMTITGIGGATPGSDNVGVRINIAAVVNAGSGGVAIQGTGGQGGNDNYGVLLTGGTPSQITTSGGNISVTGTGGSGTTGTGNYGVYVDTGSQILGSGAATVTVQGNGGTGTGASGNGGVALNAGSITSSGSGTVAVTGLAGQSSGGSDIGVDVYGSTGLISSGGGNVTVQGTGGTGSHGLQHGVLVEGNARISAGSGGTVSVTGTGTGPSGDGIALITGGGITSSGNNAITLTTNSYSGDGTETVSAGTGTVTLRNQTAGTLIDLGGADVLSGSPLTLGLSSAELNRITAGTLVLGRNDGNAAGAVAVSAPVNPALASNLTLVTGAGMAISNNLGTSGTLTLTAGNAQSVSGNGNLSANALLLNGPGANYTLDTASANTVGTLSADSVGALSYKNNSALTIGQVGGVNGISASGTVSVATASGNLNLAQNVATTDTSTAAILLNAGQSTAAGTASGGDLTVTGGASVATGSGGRATLMSGSVAGSTGLTALVGSGSDRFRYNSDESATHYSAALGTGSYAIYREQPTLTATVNNDTKTYNAAAYSGGNGVTFTGFVNGDSAVSLQGSTVYGGTAQGALNAGSYALTGSGQSSSAGYAVSYVAGTLDVSKANLTLSGTQAYNGGTAFTGANLTATGVAGETFAVSGSGATGNLASRNVQSNQALASINGLTLGSSSNGGLSGNYNPISTTGSSVSVTPAPLTVSTTDVTKTYDGTTSAAGTATVTSGTLFGSDALSGGGFAFLDKNAGNNKTVSVSGVTVSDGNSGNNYTLTLSNNTTSTINKAAVTVTAPTVSKTYDGTTAAAGSANVSTLAGAGAGESVATAPVLAFTDKNAGNNKTVQASGLSIKDSGGSDVTSNYTVSYVSNTTSTIDKANLTLSGTQAYNGGTAFTGANLTATGVAGETFAVSGSGATGNLASRNVQSNQTLASTNGLSLGASGNGGQSSDYNPLSTTGSSVSVTPAPLTVSTTDVTKTYDGTTSAAGTATVTSGTLFGGDALSGGSFAFLDKNAGNNKTVSVSGVTVSDGNSGNNYTLTLANNTSSTIHKAAVTVTAPTVTKTYDGTTGAPGSANVSALAGAGAGESVATAPVLAFTDKNAGTNKTVQASGLSIKDSGGSDVTGNYTVSYVSNTTSTIDKAALTVNANADARFVTLADHAGYNGVSYTGFVGGESASVLTGTATVSRPNASNDVAAGTYVGALVPGGLGSSNYAITYVPGNYTIVPANQLLIRVNNASAVYGSTPSYSVASAEYLDGSNSSLHTLTGSGSGNSFSYGDGAGGSVTFTLNPQGSASSTAGKTVVGSYALGDSHPSITGGNFTQLNFVGNLTVTPKGIGASASPPSKVYDGNTSITGVSLTLPGKETGDVVTVNGTGAFSQKGVGTQLGYTISGLSLSGADAGNYQLAGGTSFTGQDGVITPRPVTVAGLNAANKVYDATTSATLTGTPMVATIAGDSVSLTGGAGSFATAHAGSAKPVTVTGFTLSGADAGNYLLAQPTGLTATISPAPITLGTAPVSKTYDGTTAAAGTPTVVGGTLYGSDSLSGGSFAFTDKNAGSNKTIQVANITVSDGNHGGNYAVTYANNTH